jgi:hypothetical protein
MTKLGYRKAINSYMDSLTVMEICFETTFNGQRKTEDKTVD